MRRGAKRLLRDSGQTPAHERKERSWTVSRSPCFGSRSLTLPPPPPSDKIACYYVQRFQFHALFHITSTIGPWFMITHIIYAFYEIGADDAMPRRSLRAPEGSEPSPTLVYVCGLVPIVALSENVDNKRRS